MAQIKIGSKIDILFKLHLAEPLPLLHAVSAVCLCLLVCFVIRGGVILLWPSIKQAEKR